MSTTPAGQVLSIWAFRLKMARDGVTHPTAHGLRIIETLVEKLSALDANEPILIQEGGPGLASIIRSSTGELIIEIWPDPDLGKPN